MPLLHNCIGVEFWENEQEKELEFDEGWECDNESWEAEGFDVASIVELEAEEEDEDKDKE